MSEQNVSSTGGHSGILDDGNDNEPVGQIDIVAKPSTINNSEHEAEDNIKEGKVNSNTGQLEAKESQDNDETQNTQIEKNSDGTRTNHSRGGNKEAIRN